MTTKSYTSITDAWFATACVFMDESAGEYQRTKLYERFANATNIIPCEILTLDNLKDDTKLARTIKRAFSGGDKYNRALKLALKHLIEKAWCREDFDENIGDIKVYNVPVPDFGHSAS